MSKINHFVVMGVTSCGKSTIAALLAERLNATMVEADELHGSANIKKMERGEALNDDDRWPWLTRVAHVMQTSNTPVIVSCSALRRAYRQCLLDNAKIPIGFIHLHADREVIAERMSKRQGHFMPVSLFESQLVILEPLELDELGVTVDIEQSISQIADDAMIYISSRQ